MVKNNKNQTPKALVLALALLAVVQPSKVLAADETPVSNEASEVSLSEVDKTQSEVDRLEGEVKDAKDNLDIAQAELDQAKADQQAADSKLIEAQAKYDAAKKAKDEADKNLHDALEKQNEAADEVIDILDKQNAQKEAEDELANAQANLDEAKKDQASKQEQVKSAEDAYTNAAEDYTESQKLLGEAIENLSVAQADYESQKEELGKSITEDQEKIDDLNKQISETDPSKYTNSEKEADLKEKDQTLGDFEDDYYEKSQAHTDAIIALNNTKSQISSKENEISKLNEEIADAEDNWHEVYKKLKSGDPSVSEADEQAAYDELQRKTKAIEEKINTLNEEIDKLNDQLDNDQARVDQTADDLGTSFSDMAGKSEDYYSSEESKKVTTEIANGEITKENYEEKLSEAQDAVYVAYAEAEEAMIAWGEAEEKYNNALDQADFDRRNYEDSIKHYQSLIDNNTGYWDDSIEGFKKTVEYYQGLLDGIDKTVEDARKALDDAESRSYQANEEFARAEARLNALENASDDLEAVKNIKDNKDELEKALADAKEKLASHQKQLADSEYYLQEAKDLLEEVNQILDDSKNAIDAAQKALEEAYRARKEANEKVKEAQDDVERLEKVIADNNPSAEDLADAREKLKSAKEEVTKAKEAIKEAEDEANKAKEELEAAEKAKKEADDKLKAAQENKDQAQKELKDKEDQLLSAKDKLNVEKAKSSLRKLVDSAKEYDDEDLNKVISEVEKALDNPNLTVSEIIDLESKLTDAIAKAKVRGSQDPQEPTVDSDYKQLFLDNLKSLSKLTDAEKAEFERRMEAAKTNGEIYDIYNEAVALNSSRSQKPQASEVDEEYKQLFLDNLKSLSKLTDAEKAEFERRMEAAKTNGEVYDIYNEAVALNSSRANKSDSSEEKSPEYFKNLLLANLDNLGKLTDAEKSAYGLRIKNASSNAEAYRAYFEAYLLNSERYNPYPYIPGIIVELPSNQPSDYLRPSHTEGVSTDLGSDLIYVPSGYKHIKEGFYKRSDLVEIYERLKKALKANETLIKAVNILFENTPNTVKGVRSTLEALVKRAEVLQKEGKAALAELEKILK